MKIVVSGFSEVPKVLFILSWLNALLALRNIFQHCSTDSNQDKQLRIKRQSGILSRNYTTKYYDEKDANNSSLKDNNKLSKIILAWDWSKLSLNAKKEELLHKTCGSCVVVYNNNSKIYEKNTAALVFNYRSVRENMMPPKSIRRHDHLYVWHAGESPIYVANRVIKNFALDDRRHFNATMTPRRDATVYFPYGNAKSSLTRAKKMLHDEYDGKIEQLLKEKGETATTVAFSHCKFSPGDRILRAAIDQLEQNGLLIDKFGECLDGDHPVIEDTVDLKKTLRKYKYYLAFEDSYHCKDYITDKFFDKGLSNGVLPVVWGPKKSDYEAIAPPNSFIHIEDFNTPEQLVNYLHTLDKHSEEYLKYFRWYNMTEKDMPYMGFKSGFCQLCRLIHGINDSVHHQHQNDQKARDFCNEKTKTNESQIVQTLMYENESQDCFKSADEIIRDIKFFNSGTSF